MFLPFTGTTFTVTPTVSAFATGVVIIKIPKTAVRVTNATPKKSLTLFFNVLHS